MRGLGGFAENQLRTRCRWQKWSVTELGSLLPSVRGEVTQSLFKLVPRLFRLFVG